VKRFQPKTNILTTTLFLALLLLGACAPAASESNLNESGNVIHIDSEIEVPSSLVKVSNRYCEKRIEVLKAVANAMKSKRKQTHFCFEGIGDRDVIMEQFERNAKAAGYSADPVLTINAGGLQQFIDSESKTKLLQISYQMEADKLYVLVSHSRPI